MSITQKTIAALLAVFVALLAGATLILDRAVRPQFQRLETAAHERDQTRVSANLAAVLEDLRGRVLDYANWDDTYAYMRRPNRAYTSAFSETWFADYGVDVLFFSDDNGRTLWSGASSAALNAAVADGGAATLLAQTSLGQETGTGIVWIEGMGFVAFAATPATNSDGVAPPRGMVVLGRRLSEEALREQAQLRIDLINAANPPEALRERMAAFGSQDTQTWTERDEVVALIALRDARGQLVGAMQAHQAREITQLGASSTTLALVLFMGMSALLIAALWVLLRGAVIRRIDRMERHFNAQGADPQPLANDTARAPDEISRLTAAYNALVQRFRDASAREQAAELQREAEATANRMKSDFLANISHELRTPLNAVIGYAELIAEDMQAGESQSVAQDIGRISASARHLLTLVNEVLDLSKIEAGKIDVRPGAFDVDAMVRDVVAFIEPMTATRGNKLQVDISETVGTAYSDQLRLRQCLINVLTSASRLAENGQVSLRVTRSSDTLRFEVRSDGAAMSDAQMRRLFEPFVHADPTAARRQGGTGLGMAITRKLADMLGGSIEAECIDGVGTVFVLTAAAVYDERQASAPARAA
jgi:signal transduction histidine kinase